MLWGSADHSFRAFHVKHERIARTMDQRLLEAALRIADALDRLAPPPPPVPDLTLADAFVWHPEGRELRPVAKVSRVDLPLLQGVENQKQQILDNTARFAAGLPANNAMLWGSRGMGKSSLVNSILGQERTIVSDVPGTTRDAIEPKAAAAIQAGEVDGGGKAAGLAKDHIAGARK